MIVIHSGKDITHYISSMSWGGSKTEVARKLELSIVNATLDTNITPLTIKLGDTIYLFEDDGKTELFRGFVTDREASSVAETVTYTAYDLLFYTTKSSATYNFSGETAEGITEIVCADVNIPVGSLASTGLSQKLIVQSTSIYDIIMQAYTQAHEHNGTLYYAYAKKGKLNVGEMGKVVCDIELTDGTNLTSSNYRESIGTMINKVNIYDGEGNKVGTVYNTRDMQYGTFQTTYTKEEGKDANTVARSMFSSVEKTFSLEGINYNGAVTGAGAIVKDSATGLAGLVWIDSDTHTWSDGVATMSLTVTLKQVMDIREANSDSYIMTESNEASKQQTSGEYKGTNGSKTNPPFAILTNQYGVVRTGIPTWNETLGYYMANGGSSKGWNVVDKDNKKVVV